MTDIESLSREFCELAGICYHIDNEKCPKCNVRHVGFPYPDFTDAREVLKVMREREGWITFLCHIGMFPQGGLDLEEIEQIIAIFLDTTGLLLKEAVDFLRRGK